MKLDKENDGIWLIYRKEFTNEKHSQHLLLLRITRKQILLFDSKKKVLQNFSYSARAVNWPSKALITPVSRCIVLKVLHLFYLTSLAKYSLLSPSLLLL